MTSQPVAAGKVVSIHYSLTLASGETVDSSAGGEPLAYLHGKGNIVPGLERQITGKAAGAQFKAVVPPAEGYGVRDEARVRTLPRNVFPRGQELEPGMQFGTEDEQGNPVPFWITGVTKDQVTVDFNHPLAGETLHFAIEVVAVRDATAEEMSHGHPHNPGEHGDHGHHHH